MTGRPVNTDSPRSTACLVAVVLEAGKERGREEKGSYVATSD